MPCWTTIRTGRRTGSGLCSSAKKAIASISTVIRPDGSGERALTRNTGADCAWSSTPAWSPDGRWIAYENSVHGMGYRIKVMAADGSNARFVTQGGTEGVNDVRPAWSPDGKWIAL